MTSDLERRVGDELSSGGRVLVSRLQYLGDVILTLPAVHALRERYPSAEIDYLTRADGAAILDGERVFARVLKVPEETEGTLAAWRLVSAMRRRRYAASVDLFSNPRSAILTWLSGAKLRIGGARRIRKHMYTHPTVTPPGIRSAIDHHLYYLRPLGVTAKATKPTLRMSDAELARGRELLAEYGMVWDGHRLVGIHPGGKWEVKRWPVDHFADLAQRLIEVHGCRVAVLSGPGEQSYQNELRSRLGSSAVYVPSLPLRGTAAVIGSLDGVVVNDGGIMHVSVAVSTPTVGMFGSSEPDIWFPYEPFGPYAAAYVPIHCRPCHQHTCGHLSCLRGLSPGMVEAKIIGVMAAAGDRERHAGAAGTRANERGPIEPPPANVEGAPGQSCM